MKAILAGIVKEQYRVRSAQDHRKFVDRYTFAYRLDQYEWRKSIEVPVGSSVPSPEYSMDCASSTRNDDQ